MSRTEFVNKSLRAAFLVMLLAVPLFGQGKRLWVLKASGEMVEYDPATFAAKQTVKMPAEALKNPGNISVNRLGQILFAPTISLPLSEEDAASAHKVWIWNGHAATTFDEGIERKVEETGSNQAVSESAPAVYLSVDGKHLFWFANSVRRLQREEVDLSTSTTWQAWQTDLAGTGREELISVKLPDCRCTTGTCEESCPVGVAWADETGIDKLFLMNEFVAGQTVPSYKASTRYLADGGKWTGTAFPEPLQKVLDASPDGNTIVEAIPDTGCCGWSNQSDDQTVARVNGKKVTIFDEQSAYKNADYDVSFFTSNARLSPDGKYVAMTIGATAQSNKPIQLSEQGQASPEESQRIRKALADLPAVLVKSVDDVPKQVASVPHASLVGWISEKEMLIVEEHVLAVYNVESGARKKSAVRVEDAAHAFLR
jgi:hypothetical protein